MKTFWRPWICHETQHPSNHPDSLWQATPSVNIKKLLKPKLSQEWTMTPLAPNGHYAPQHRWTITPSTFSSDCHSKIKAQHDPNLTLQMEMPGKPYQLVRGALAENKVVWVMTLTRNTWPFHLFGDKPDTDYPKLIPQRSHDQRHTSMFQQVMLKANQENTQMTPRQDNGVFLSTWQCWELQTTLNSN